VLQWAASRQWRYCAACTLPDRSTVTAASIRATCTADQTQACVVSLGCILYDDYVVMNTPCHFCLCTKCSRTTTIVLWLKMITGFLRSHVLRKDYWWIKLFLSVKFSVVLLKQVYTLAVCQTQCTNHVLF